MVDAFYHQLCPDCAALSHAKRDARTDLTGPPRAAHRRRAKIGMYIALRLLRDGAHLTITTRFPRDAVRRFSAQPDSSEWLDRLKIVGIDLRDPPQVIGLADEVAAAGPLDILINNAAQTVKRQPGAYQAIADAELQPLPEGFVPELVTFGHTSDAHPASLVGSVSSHPALAGDAVTADELTALALEAGSADLERIDGRRPPARPRRHEQLGAARRSGRRARAARGPSVQQRRAVHPRQPSASRHGGLGRAPQVRRQRLGDGGAVRPRLQGVPATPHTNMAKAALNMLTAHERPRDVRVRRHPHDRRRHRLDHRRASSRDEAAPRAGGLQGARSTSSTEPRASTTRSSRRGRRRPPRRVPQGLRALPLVSGMDLTRLSTERLELAAVSEGRPRRAARAERGPAGLAAPALGVVHTDVQQTRDQIADYTADWERDGLGYWIARRGGELVGIGECGAAPRHVEPLLPDRSRAPRSRLRHRGRPGGRRRRPRGSLPTSPSVAYLLEHNEASRRTAERVGLGLVWRGPDHEVPDGIRLVLSRPDARRGHARHPPLTPGCPDAGRRLVSQLDHSRLPAHTGVMHALLLVVH